MGMKLFVGSGSVGGGGGGLDGWNATVGETEWKVTITQSELGVILIKSLNCT